MKNLILNLVALVMLSLIVFTFNTNAQIYNANGIVNPSSASSSNTGISQENPLAQLHIGYHTTMSSNVNGYGSLGHNYRWNSGAKKIKSNIGTFRMLFNPNGDLYMATASKSAGTTLNGTNFSNKFIILNSGLTMIGEDAHTLNNKISGFVSADDYRLIVGTGILTEKVKVALYDTNDWADYVFEEDYDLNSIEEVEDFVKENKHLPNIPSAKEMVNTGLDVAEMDAKLLRQIEELWLQMIDLNQEVKDLNQEVKGLKAENEALKASK